MAGSVNSVVIVGNLTRDPELRATPSGKRNYEMLAAEVLRAARALLGELDEEEKYTLLAMLRKITAVKLE